MAALGALALLLQSAAGSDPKWLLNVGAEPDYTQAELPCAIPHPTPSPPTPRPEFQLLPPAGPPWSRAG